MEKINAKIKSIEQTCDACPSQWEIELEDGRFVYVRYRFGSLSYGIGKTIDNAVMGTNGYDSEDIGDGFDGTMGEKEMIDLVFK